MNYITLVMVGLTVLPILFGALLGLLRGSRRALLRLILIVVCVAVAFALTGVVTKAVMNMQIEAIGGTVIDYLKQVLLGNLPESMAEFAIPIAQSILQVVIFLLLFSVLLLLTWAIVYPLCKLFVKKGKRPHRVIGLVIGAVQGVVVALVVCVIMTGLIVQANNVMVASSDLNQIIGGVETQSAEGDNASNVPAEEDNSMDLVMGILSEYSDSGLAKMYNAIGAKPFALISQVKLEDGSKITFPGQVEAVCGLVDMAKELTELQGVQYDKLLTKDNIDKLEIIFGRLDEIKDGLSDEARTTVNKLMTTLSNEMGLANFNGINLMDINFQKEGEIFTRLYQYNEKDVSELTVDDAKSILHDIAQSDLILDMLQQKDGVNLSSQLNADEHQEIINGILEEMEADDEISQEKIDALRQIFGV